MKRLSRYLPLIVLLVLAAILLSGCNPTTIDPETGEQVYNSESIWEYIAKPMRSVMVFFHDLLDPLSAYAWGWAIILVAVLIRVLLLPLGLRQMRSMRVAQVKMQALQPELDAMKKKYAKDKQKLQEEQMKLYQKHGIMQAQMAGCLPTLLQMPILIAFYYALVGLVLQSNFDDQVPFYFIPDLAYPFYGSGLSWLTSDFSLQKLLEPDVWPYLVLPIFLAITQYVMTKMSQSSQPAADPNNPASGMMGQMAILMTGMFVFFSLSVPSGVSLYWVVGNLLAMAQQLYVNRQKVHWAQEIAPVPAAIVETSEPEPEEETKIVSSNGKGKYASDSAAAADLSESSASPRRKRRRRR